MTVSASRLKLVPSWALWSSASSSWAARAASAFWRCTRVGQDGVAADSGGFWLRRVVDRAVRARVAGGIYTKAADVGADLVGKVAARHGRGRPAQPGGDRGQRGRQRRHVAGMGADLFESYVGSIIAAATLAKRDNEIALPFWLSACGVVAAMVGTMAVSTNEKGEGLELEPGALDVGPREGHDARWHFVLGP